MTPANADLVPIWNEIDKHRERHRKLELEHAETKGKVDLLASKIDSFDSALKDHRSESKEGIAQIRTQSKEGMERLQVKLEELLQAHQVNKGRELSKRELIWIVTTLGSLVLAVWQILS